MSADDELNRLHWLRGAYIAKTIEIEERVDSVITTFFRVDGRFHELFSSYVLSELNLRAKIATVERIISEIDGDYGDLCARLRTMADRRNALAHRSIKGVVVWDDEGRRDGGLAQRQRKPKHPRDMYQSVDVAALESELAALDELIVPLTSLLAECFYLWPHYSRTGGGPSVPVDGTLELHSKRR